MRDVPHGLKVVCFLLVLNSIWAAFRVVELINTGSLSASLNALLVDDKLEFVEFIYHLDLSLFPLIDVVLLPLLTWFGTSRKRQFIMLFSAFLVYRISVHTIINGAPLVGSSSGVVISLMPQFILPFILFLSVGMYLWLNKSAKRQYLYGQSV